MSAMPRHLICIHYDQPLVLTYDDGCQGNPSLELTEKYSKIDDPVWKEMARTHSVKHKNDQRTRIQDKRNMEITQSYCLIKMPPGQGLF